MKQIITYIAFFIALCCVGVVSVFLTKYYMQKDIDNLTTAYTTDIETERNKSGQLETKVLALETNSQELLALLGKSDEKVEELNKVIDKYKGRNSELVSALIVANQTIVELKDTITQNNIVGSTEINDTVYYTYEKDFNLTNPYNDKDSIQWVIGKVLLGKKDFSIAMLIKNEYEIAITRERKNIFSRWKSVVHITNRNPFDITKGAIAFSQPKEKRKPWVVSIGVGYGMSKDGLSPVVSINFGYKLIEF